jgi:hypothetical protein
VSCFWSSFDALDTRCVALEGALYLFVLGACQEALGTGESRLVAPPIQKLVPVHHSANFRKWTSVRIIILHPLRVEISSLLFLIIKKQEAGEQTSTRVSLL